MTVLATERECLTKGDGAVLPEITTRKSELAAQLANIDARRDATLKAGGFSPGRVGIETWLATLPKGKNSNPHAAWKSLQELAAKAKRENELNGKLIASRLQLNQQALGVLLGEAVEGNTYGADGQRNTKPGRRNLGSA